MDESWVLNRSEVRVLGVLIEKQVTTPEYYPLSLNALVNGCNQKSNREPVMTLDEEEVRLALRNLQDKGLATVTHDARAEIRASAAGSVQLVAWPDGVAVRAAAARGANTGRAARPQRTAARLRRVR